MVLYMRYWDGKEAGLWTESLTENETPLLRYSIYFYGRTTYIVITAKPQHETSIRIRGSGSTTLYITDIKEP